jgi:hypothetical protein
VVAILGILAIVVVVSVVGLLGRGQAEGYATDERTIQTAVSAFYATNHGYSATNGGWNEKDNITYIHTFPTRHGIASNLYPGMSVKLDKWEVWEIWSAPDTRATFSEIDNAAIWMGLLTKQPGSGTGVGNVTDTKDNTAPLGEEEGPYLSPLPDSCGHDYNASEGKGSYTWIVGAYGRVYGVFEQGGVWYKGFGGRYP